MFERNERLSESETEMKVERHLNNASNNHSSSSGEEEKTPTAFVHNNGFFLLLPLLFTVFKCAFFRQFCNLDQMIRANNNDESLKNIQNVSD